MTINKSDSITLINGDFGLISLYNFCPVFWCPFMCCSPFQLVYPLFHVALRPFRNILVRNPYLHNFLLESNCWKFKCVQDKSTNSPFILCCNLRFPVRSRGSFCLLVALANLSYIRLGSSFIPSSYVQLFSGSVTVLLLFPGDQSAYLGIIGALSNNIRTNKHYDCTLTCAQNNLTLI